MIYLCTDFPDDISLDIIEKLPCERRERLKRYKRSKDRVLCAISYLLLKYALEKEFYIHISEFWKTGKYGKPYFENNNDIEFNISHCDIGAVCLVCKKKCGIDIQNISDISEDIMHMVCSKDELNEIKESKNPQQKSCFFWTLKEAYGKYRGEGLTDDIKKYDFSNTNSKNFQRFGCCFSIFYMEDYIISICSERFFEKNEIIKLEY